MFNGEDIHGSDIIPDGVYTVTIIGELSNIGKEVFAGVIPYEYELTVLPEPTVVDIDTIHLGGIMDTEYPNYIVIPSDKTLEADGLQYIRDNLTLRDTDGVIPFGEPIITVLRANGLSDGRFVNNSSSVDIEVTCENTDEYTYNPFVGVITVLVK